MDNFTHEELNVLCHYLLRLTEGSGNQTIKRLAKSLFQAITNQRFSTIDNLPDKG